MKDRLVACSMGLTVVAVAAMWPGVVPEAQACGGTFCDAGPTAMPVEQTGETIVFAVDATHVEVQIQIEYDPDTEASQFAWIVPVSALPEFSVGSQELFSRLLTGTVPRYGVTTWREVCEPDDGGGGDESCDGGDSAAGDDGDAGELLDLGGGDPGGAPDVVLEQTVGAFDVVVLDGGTVDGVMTWLGENGYTQDEAAAPILGEYLDEGQMFVAFRLSDPSEAGQIHPIALRYEGRQPCVPIRLTRIAAQDDLEIRALFLGDSRFASSNYADVVLNPLKIDWLGQGINYGEVVSMALDEAGVDGHGFVTEYAGPSSVAPDMEFVPFYWDAELFQDVVMPTEAVMLVRDLDLVGFDATGDCTSPHPLVDGIIDRYLPVGDAVERNALCFDPLSYAAAVDPEAWDGAAFAEQFETRVLAPAQHAQQLLATWPYLTRLYTRLSPHEMTEDPMFHATPQLPTQTTLSNIGTRNRFCNGETSFNLPDGRLLALPQGAWPSIGGDAMPWAELVQYLPAKGAPLVEVDNGPVIEQLLEAWNAEVGPPRSPTSPATPIPGCDTFSDPTSPSSGGPGATAEAGGCGCRGGTDEAPAWWSLVPLAFVVRRRWRRVL